MNQNQDTPLHLAVRSGDVNKVKGVLLNSKMSINSIDRKGRTPLELACKIGNLDIIKTLIDHTVQDDKGTIGDKLLKIALNYEKDEVILLLITKLKCDPNIKGGYYHRSPLHVACKKGNLSLVRTLIRDYHADLNENDYNGKIPFTLALDNRSDEVMLVLISEFGFGPTNIMDRYGTSPLHVACKKGNLSLVRTLIRDYHADLNDKDYFGGTPFTWALNYRRDEVLLVLISEFGCDLTNIKGRNDISPLHVACMNGNLSLVRTLIHDYLTDLNDKDHFGNTPFVLALENERDEVMLVLISEFGYNPTYIKGRYGVSSLHVACKKGNLSLVRTLIRDYHADLNDKDHFSNTPFVLALENERDEVMLVLISEFGYNPNYNIKGRHVSPLHVACKKGNLSLVRTLIRDYHADFNDKDHFSNTPFVLALENERDEVMLVLISEFGYNPNYNIKGRHVSPLHVACKKGNLSLIRTLIRNYHADLNDKDHFSNTSFVLALENERDEVMLVLISEFGYNPTYIKGRHDVSPLHVACKKGNLSLVRTLIRDYHADLNDKDHFSNTPFVLALKNERDEVMLVLISEFGCDPSKIKYPLLLIACKKGNFSLLKTLVYDYHMDLNDKDCLNFKMALENERDEIALGLFDYGYDPKAKDERGRSLLHLACEKDRFGVARALILNQHLELHAQDSDGNTPLVLAAENGREEVVLALINEFGCDPNNKDSKGRSLLHVILYGGWYGLFKTLIYYFNFDLNGQDDCHETPLTLAIKHEREIRGISLESSSAEFICSLLKELLLDGKLRYDSPLGAIQPKQLVSSMLRQFNIDPNLKDFEGGTLLHLACREGRIDVVHTLIQTFKAELNIRDDHNDTPLMKAVEYGRCETVKSLISDYGCDISIKGSNGYSLLHIAIVEGHMEMFEMLVSEFGMSPIVIDGDGNTPLMLAIKKDRNELVLALLEKYSCGPNTKDNEGNSTLHVACMKGNLTLIKALMSHGADQNAIDGCSNTPLMLAIKNNSHEVELAQLTQYGCDPSNQGYPSLHVPHMKGNHETLINGDTGVDLGSLESDTNSWNEVALVLLIEYGCDPNTKDNDGYSPLHVACMKGDFSLVEALINHGADPNTMDVFGNTPLMLAIKNNFNEIVLSLLTQYGCDPNIKDNDGYSPLHVACVKGNLAIFQPLVSHGVALESNTLILAIANSWNEVVFALLSEYGCDPNTKDNDGNSPLHVACIKGNFDVIKALISHGADQNSLDSGNDAPITLAVKNGWDEVVLTLIRECGCDPNTKDSHGRSLLHHTLEKGRYDLFKTLINTYNLDLNARDVFNETPLMLAVKYESIARGKSLSKNFHHLLLEEVILYGELMYDTPLGAIKPEEFMPNMIRQYNVDPNLKYAEDDDTLFMKAVKYERYEIMKILICDHGCDPNIKGYFPLHITCKKGDLSLVKILITHGADLNTLDEHGHTPLMTAMNYGRYEIVKSFVCDYGCDPNIEGYLLLHMACKESDLSLVQTLITHGADLNTLDEHGHTPLMTAMNYGRYEIVKSFVCDYGCDPNIEGYLLLHMACKESDLSLVQTLITHGADLNALDEHGHTPLMTAMNYGRYEIVKSFVCDYGCDPNIEGYLLLHIACKESDLSLVQTLITHGADLNALDEHGYTPVMIAVECGNCELVELLHDYGCDINVTASNGWSLLHIAVSEGHTEIFEMLVSKFGMSPLVVDEAGDTPLHVCAELGHYDCVRFSLQEFQPPIYIRNRAGKTPINVVRNHVKPLFDHYLSHSSHAIQADYQSMQKLAKKKFSGAHHITKLFVVGHPGAGKSSLVEALKRESFIKSLSRVSKKSVPPHTAGIVPSIHTSSRYGRVQFYDFAGDPEYYSSHAAILERIFQSKIGTTICIIVLDLREDDEEIEKKIIYWSTFISNSSKNPQNLPSLLVIGSHSDLLPNRREVRRKNDFILSMISKYDKESVYFSLDCRYPRSDNLYALRKHIKTMSEKSKPYSLSQEMSILLGLLEKDFQNVTACPAHVLVDHINQVGLCLPRSMTHLHPLLQQLQDIGELLIVGGEENDSYLILSISQLTNEVHKKLFSKEPDSKPDDHSFNIGLLPESFLQEILPEHITRECLIQLQYCQEISPVEIDPDYSILPSPEPSTLPNQSLMFFPALCTVERRDISWLIPSTRYSIGWLARCSDSRPRDYFPSRFLHVLLLRIALRFTVLAPSPQAHHVPSGIKRQCYMWKTGVHWVMGKGVECTVELLNTNKILVMTVRGYEEHASEKYSEIVTNIISCVMEAKTEFCHSIQPDFFLLDSTDEDDYLNEDNLFSMSTVENFLLSPEGEEIIISDNKKKIMSCKKLIFMRNLIYWYSLFPIDFLLSLLEEVGNKWHDLGLELGLPNYRLGIIEEENPRNVQKCLKEMVSAWMNSSRDPPCWGNLAMALRERDMGRLADEIEKKYGEFVLTQYSDFNHVCFVFIIGNHIDSQKKLLDPECHAQRPDEEFLESFAGVVGSKWPSLASLLSLTSDEMQKVRRGEEGFTQKDHALLMLKKWASKEEVTYGQLYNKLKTIPPL